MKKEIHFFLLASIFLVLWGDMTPNATRPLTTNGRHCDCSVRVRGKG